MKLIDRIALWFNTNVRAGLHDLFGEEALPAALGGRKAPPLDELRYRLQALLPELARLAADEKRTGDERKLALDQIARLDAEIDAAVRAKNEDQARALLETQNRLNLRAVELAYQQSELNDARLRLQAETTRLETDLEELRQRTQDTESRRRAAQALEELEILQREAHRALDQSEEELAVSEEQARQAEDRLAAQRELRRR